MLKDLGTMQTADDLCWTSSFGQRIGVLPMQQPDVPAQGKSFRQALWFIWGACKHWQLS